MADAKACPIISNIEVYNAQDIATKNSTN